MLLTNQKFLRILVSWLVVVFVISSVGPSAALASETSLSNDSTNLQDPQPTAEVTSNQAESDQVSEPEQDVPSEENPSEENESAEEETITDKDEEEIDKEQEAEEPEPVKIDLPPSTVKQNLPDADINSGALVYQYLLAGPPGRSGLQSDISLQYHSQNNEEGSAVGYGWNLNLPYIERKNINGVNKIYTSDDFSSSIDGDLKKVSITTDGGKYGAKINNGTYLDYAFINTGTTSQWVVTTKTGEKYYYGLSEESKISNPNDGTKVSRWYLSKVEDTFTNFISYQYIKHGNLPYLETVNYTGHDTSDGLFTARFNWQERPDKQGSAKYGYLLKTTHRLQSVELSIGEDVIGSYQLSYQQALVNQRSLLSSIEYIGQGGSGNGNVSSGLTKFVYQQQPAYSLLAEVTQPTGGTTTIEYVSSTQLRQAEGSLSNPNMPFGLPVVKNIEYDDKNGVQWERNYDYTGGWFYYNGSFDRRFVGFEKVSQTDSVGNTTVTWYHQGNGNNSSFNESGDDWSKAGKAYRVEIYDALGNLYERVINSWEFDRLAGVENTDARSFVKLSGSLAISYDGNSDFRAKAVSYDYDSMGNLVSKVNYGEVSVNGFSDFVDIGVDKTTLNIDYAERLSDNSLTGYVSSEVLLNQSNEKLQESKNLYDGLAYGAVNVGNITQKQQWVGGTTYSTSNYTYNNFGLPLSETDPNDNTTTYVYDEHDLYPESVTNALSQVTNYEYDYRFGQPTKTTDANGLLSLVNYDSLGRQLSEKLTIPGQSNPNNLFTKQTWQYSLYEISGQVKGWKTTNEVYLDKPNDSNPRITKQISYTDGFDRIIQTRSQVESELGSNQDRFSVTDTKYNNIAQVEKTTLPYFSNGAARTNFTSHGQLHIDLAYDSLYRVVATENALGVSTNSYDNWNVRVTDANGKIKDLFKDAYGQLVSVGERTAGDIYTTSYEYDGVGNLKRITDALGNVRNFQFDGRALRTMAEDLHSPNDISFGVWSYAYDLAGNLTERTDANGLVAAYGYDELNRVVSENAGKDKSVEVVYEYDNCPNGIGRLCVVNTDDLSHSMQYNLLGQITSETKTIDGVNYINGFSYDRQGNLLLTINPDGSEVKNSYSEAGNLQSVERKEVTDNSYSNVITNIDYTPIGAVGTIAYVNGSQTTNVYDENQLYRLASKVTTVPIAGGGVRTIQNYAYEYDAVGNIIRINDISELNTRKTVRYWYDDLHRLTLARTSHAVGGANYIQNYEYNAIGNITYKSDVGHYNYEGSLGNNYANPHAVTSITANGVAIEQFSYDQNGNMLSDVDKTIEWDYNNRISTITPNGIAAVPINYSYDASGGRIKASVSGGITTIYPSQTYNTAGGITDLSVQKHIFAGELLVATIKGSGPTITSSTPHSDHLGSTTVVTDSLGGVAETLDYYPFGAIRYQSTSSGTTEQRKFIGQEYDAETELSYLQARYYNGRLGKFLSQDVVHLSFGDIDTISQITGVAPQVFLSDPQSFNSYSYSRNNPLRYVDPEGQFFREKWEEAKKQYNNGVVWVGNKTEQAYQNNSVVRYALDHPYQAGAAIGVAGGALVAGGVVVGGGAITCGVVCGGAATVAGTATPVVHQVQKNHQQIIAAGNRTLNLTQHALSRMTERGITQQQVSNIAQKGQQFNYVHEGVSKVGYYDPISKVLVATAKSSGNITTVIKNVSQSYVNGLAKTAKQ